MNCLDQYRGKLLTAINRNLRTIVAAADEEAIHRFRVGVKRLTALYRFVGEVEPEIGAKRLLKPARRLSGSVSKVRDGHIARKLLAELPGLKMRSVISLQRAIDEGIRRDYDIFQELVGNDIRIPLRLPTVSALGLSESRLLRHKAPALEQLLGGIVGVEDRGDAEHWHGIRILLKRYHHTLEAFDLCPGHRRDEAELSQIGMLEQLLGDWHDRVITAEILQALPRREKQCAPAIAELGRQQALLLGSARIYLARYSLRKTATWRDPGCTG